MAESRVTCVCVVLSPLDAIAAAARAKGEREDAAARVEHRALRHHHAPFDVSFRRLVERRAALPGVAHAVALPYETPQRHGRLLDLGGQEQTRLRDDEAVVPPERLAREELVEEALRRHDRELRELQPHAALVDEEAGLPPSLLLVVRAHAVAARRTNMLRWGHGRRRARGLRHGARGAAPRSRRAARRLSGLASASLGAAARQASLV